jgi:osmotically-inducible protein OsmY
MRRFLTLVGTGAGLMYLFDPQQGNRRRAMARDRAAGMFRRLIRRTERMGRGAAAQAYGVKQKATHMREEPKDLDDVTLARKVETEIFRDADAPKGQVSVNAANGVVTLRGEVESTDLVDDLEKRTRKVSGVERVENLLHTPGEQARTSGESA